MEKFPEIWRNFTLQNTENWLSWADLERYIWKLIRIWFYYRILNTMSNYSLNRNVLVPLSRAWKKGISPNLEKFSKFKKFHFSKFGEISPKFRVPWLLNCLEWVTFLIPSFSVWENAPVHTFSSQASYHTLHSTWI